MAAFGPSAYGGGAATVANQFAAMPSLHVGWALLIALVVVRTAKSRWRWIVVAHPVITTLVVVVTANHYWVDAVVVALLLGLVLLVTPRPAAVPPSNLWLRLTGRYPGATPLEPQPMPGRRPRDRLRPSRPGRPGRWSAGPSRTPARRSRRRRRPAPCRSRPR